MFARQCPQLEQPHFDFIQPRRFELQRARRRVQLVLRFTRFDYRAIERGQSIGQHRMRIGQPVELARSATDERYAAFRAVETVDHRLQVVGNPLAFLHVGSFACELLLFAFLRVERLQFGNCVFQPLTVTRGIFDTFTRHIEACFGFPPRGEIGRNAGCIAPPEYIEQRPVSARIEEPPVIMLPVNFDQQRADIAQQRGRTGLVVDKRLAAAIGLNRSPDNERLARVDVDIVIGKQRHHVRWRIEACGHLRLGRPAAHQTAIGPRPQRQPQRIEQYRFARPGLPGQHAKPG